MVQLHEEHLPRFVQTWRLAMAVPVSLPPTADPNYASLVALGRHVLGAAGGYLVWMCEVLRLPDPEVRPAPDPVAIVRDADDYLEHILERWRAEALLPDHQLKHFLSYMFEVRPCRQSHRRPRYPCCGRH